MSHDDSWITARINAARERSPLVTEAVCAHMGELLKGRLSDRQLPKGELAELAKKLLVGMVQAVGILIKGNEN